MNPIEFRTGAIKPVEIYKEAWELIKPQFWLVFGVTIVGILIGSIIPFVTIGPMMCGIFMCLLKVIDRKPMEFGDLFKGFDFLWKSLPISIAIMLPVFVLLIVMYIPMIGIAIAGNKMSESELIPFLFGVIIFELVAAIVMVCFHTLLLFAFPLVADRGLSGLDAIKLSFKAVWKNLAGMAGLLAVGMVIAMVSYLVFCVGIYFAMPLIIMGQAVAYRKIFPALPSNSYDPPPPGAYQGVSN